MLKTLNNMFERYLQLLYVHKNDSVVRHLFRVASSLDSMVVGETQILGQVKEAFDAALLNKTTGVVLNKLFKKSISVAKRIRTETKIGESAVSISFAAVELAKKIFSNLRNKTGMLIGAGEMGELAAQYLVNSGIKEIVVSTRNYERALNIAKSYNGRVVRFEDFMQEMENTDVVICSTGAPDYIIRYDDMQRIMQKRKNRPLFLIDISVPRNIDPEINRIDKFATKGCAVLCHNESKNQDDWYYAVNSPAEKGDMWHWKAYRSNPMGYADDGYVTVGKKPEEGRKGDAGTGKAKKKANRCKI